MTDIDPFERQLRATLAAMAGEPAPDRLVARVAEIPDRQPMPPRNRWAWLPPVGRGAAGFALAALALVVIVGALALLPGGFLGIGASPSNVPTATPTVSPSPTASPTPTPTPTPTGPSSGALPADFGPISATFVSTDEGWALGGTACGAERCAVVAHTLDGGRTWTRRPAPPTTVNASLTLAAGALGVSGLRFADPRDGWAFGPELWATHDGGATWRRVSIAGDHVLRALLLEAAGGRVQAVTDKGDAPENGFGFASSPVGSDDWRMSSVTVPFGAGPVPQPQLVLAGTAGWMIENDRVVIGGARLVSGTWQTWQPPCLDVNGPAVLAASSASHVIAVCQEAVWGPFMGSSTPSEHLYLSTDGGLSFTRTAAAMPVDVYPSALAAPTSSTIVAAGGTSSGNVVMISRDSGRTWTTALRLGEEAVSYVGFTTSTQGILLSDKGMRMTYDGGRTWQVVQF